MKSVLTLKDVSFGYSQDYVLDQINLNIHDGEFVGIVGLNGSGKSTLLKLILGINKPTKGELIKDKKTTIGYVNQTTMTEEGGFPATIFEVVSLGLKKKPFHIINKRDKERVYKMLELFNLKNLANKSVSSLSGGQAQKVKIAKVLLSNPDIIVLDEPTSGIDEGSEEMLIQIINHLHAMKKTVLFVSHNPLNLKACDTCYKVENKKIFPFDINKKEDEYNV